MHNILKWRDENHSAWVINIWFISIFLPLLMSVILVAVWEFFELNKIIGDTAFGFFAPFVGMLLPSFVLLMSINGKTKFYSLAAFAVISVPYAPLLFFVWLFNACYIFGNCI